MRSFVKVVSLVLLTFLSTYVGAVDYYVSPVGLNTNRGTTKAEPFKTISKAVSVVAAGDVVHVASGTYAEHVYTTKDGEATARIRFVSDSVWGAKIVPPSSSSRSVGFDNRGMYVTIDGFEVDGSVGPTSGTKWTVGINVGGTGDSVVNCHVHHIYHASTDIGNDNGGAAILLDNYYGKNDMHAHRNMIHHVGPSVGGSVYHGIYQTATGTIKNNLAYAITGVGVHCWHNAHKIHIANNTVFGSGSGFAIGGGDYANDYGQNFYGPCDSMTLTNNIAYDNTGFGFDEEGENGAHNIFSNNLSYKNDTNWRLNTSKHVNDITAEPQFVNYIRNGGGNYHLRNSSPALDKGLTTFAPSIDFDGVVRPQGNGIDLGAFEYKASSTNITKGNVLVPLTFAMVASPNPFHATGIVRVFLPEAKRIVLAVYSVDGRFVRKIADQLQNPGTHSFLWHGDDAMGSKVSAGVYVYRLTAGSRVVLARTMMVQ